MKELSLNPAEFPDIVAVAADRDAYINALDPCITTGKTNDDIKKLLISIAYLCARQSHWPQRLLDLRDQWDRLVKVNARQNPKDIDVAT